MGTSAFRFGHIKIPRTDIELIATRMLGNMPKNIGK